MLGANVSSSFGWMLLDVEVAFQKGFPCSSGMVQMTNQVSRRIHKALYSCQDPVIRRSNRLDRGFWVPMPRYRGLIAVLFPWGCALTEMGREPSATPSREKVAFCMLYKRPQKTDHIQRARVDT